MSEAGPNDPCRSNDGELFLLTTADDDGYVIDETTGERKERISVQGDDAFLLSPCFEDADSESPTPSPSAEPTPRPSPPPTTRRPTKSPTTTPSADPTFRPSPSPSEPPTESPTTPRPTPPPTRSPTPVPSADPTRPPPPPPSEPPTRPPTPRPTRTPTTEPPSPPPSTAPTREPTTAEPTSESPTTEGPSRGPIALPIATTTSPTFSDGTPQLAELPISYYDCSSSSSGGNSSSSSSSSSSAPPSGATELTLTYDYELHTSSPLDEDVLSSFEDSITRDLAGRYGLIDCGVEPKRRRLRTLKRGEIVALDSAPADESSDDDDCQVPVDIDASSSSNCTPMRGYTTAYLPNSENADQTEAELLALIENGMRTDSYISDDVIKASYVGARDEAGDAAQDGQGQGSRDDGGSGNSNGGNSDPVNNANPATGGPNLDGAKETENPPVESNAPNNGLPLLLGGVAVLALALALAALLVLYLRKKRRSRRLFTDGPDGHDDGNLHLAPPGSENPPPRTDPDDVRLLPAPDKLDMRSVHSESDLSTDAETENHTYEEYEDYERQYAEAYGTLYKSRSYGSGGSGLHRNLSSTTQDYGDMAENGVTATPKLSHSVEVGYDDAVTPRSSNVQMTGTSGGGSGRGGGGSALAAMGMASTLAVRSFAPPPAIAAATPVSNSATSSPASGDANTAESSNYVGTVYEKTPRSVDSSSAGSSFRSADGSAAEEILGSWGKLGASEEDGGSSYSSAADSSSAEVGGGFRTNTPMADWT